MKRLACLLALACLPLASGCGPMAVMAAGMSNDPTAGQRALEAYNYGQTGQLPPGGFTQPCQPRTGYVRAPNGDVYRYTENCL